MHLIGKPIEKPEARFEPGDRVRFIPGDDETGTYTVIVSTHTHTQLEGFKFGVANSRLRRVRKACKKATEETRIPYGEEIRKRDRPDDFKIDSQILLASEKPLKDTRP